jgi:hypothetical protein
MQRFAEYAQNNSDTIVKVMLAVGALAGGILALNAVLKVITVLQLALNVAMAANPIGLVVTAVALLVAGFAVLVAKTGGVKNAFATMGNFIIGIFEAIGNSYVSMINTVIDGLNLINPFSDIPKLGEFVLPRFSMTSGGGTTDAGPDFLERQLARTSTMPSIAPLTLPAPVGGSAGGGSARGGGAGVSLGAIDSSFSTNFGISDEMLFGATASNGQRTLPDVINITVNAAIAEASLGQTIVDALTDYSRSSGPLELQIAI